MEKDNTYQYILDLYDTYSQQQKKIADFIMTNLHDVIYFPLSKLVDAIGVSQATIVRFAQRLGYRGFNEFRDVLFRYYKRYLSPEGRMKHSIEALDRVSPDYEKITRGEIAYLKASIESVDEAVFKAAVDTICKAKKVYIFGSGPNEHLACHLSFRLRRLKISVQKVSASGLDLFEHLLLLDREGLAVVYSFAKPSIDYRRLMAALSDKEVPILLITDMQTPPVIRLATYVLYAERGPQGTFPSPIVPMAITNALLLRVAERLEQKSVEALRELGDLRDSYFYTDRFSH